MEGEVVFVLPDHVGRTVTGLGPPVLRFTVPTVPLGAPERSSPQLHYRLVNFKRLLLLRQCGW